MEKLLGFMHMAYKVVPNSFELETENNVTGLIAILV